MANLVTLMKSNNVADDAMAFVSISRFCLKTKHPTVGQTEGMISVFKQKLIRVDRAKTQSLIKPLMGGKLHEVLSKGGFPL